MRLLPIISASGWTERTDAVIRPEQLNGYAILESGKKNSESNAHAELTGFFFYIKNVPKSGTPEPEKNI